jgi:hypothetical protein
VIIHKYPLRVAPEQHVEMPSAARILCVQVQNDTICLWAAVVNPAAPMQARTIQIVGTGNLFENDLTYLGTVQLERGQFVFHVFERRAPA